MFDLSRMSSPAAWFLGGGDAASPLCGSAAPRNTDAAGARMWVIAGPQGMSVTAAKRALGIRPGPADLVIYSHIKFGRAGAPPPRLVSCQPYTH